MVEGSPFLRLLNITKCWFSWVSITLQFRRSPCIQKFRDDLFAEISESQFDSALVNMMQNQIEELMAGFWKYQVNHDIAYSHG
ncbi:hypothetical protein [Microbulbifer epialgicus]|uniref:Uncharacterized protein n=1 Tax=Microbulbifer epialgicus TaxID=393907 RepID=A0ABV4P613_9GAMM